MIRIAITEAAFKAIAQLNPTEQSGTDSFTAQAFSGAHISDGTATGSDAPNDDKQFSLTAVGGAFDEVNLLSADGFKEIKHIEISGRAAVPEASTWAMGLIGFGLLGLLGYRKTRSDNALA
jgi:PEP-CTERM motif